MANEFTIGAELYAIHAILVRYTRNFVSVSYIPHLGGIVPVRGCHGTGKPVDVSPAGCTEILT